MWKAWKYPGTDSEGCLFKDVMDCISLIDKLFQEGNLERSEFAYLIDHRNEESNAYLFEKARIRQKEHFGNTVYQRGLIEFSNYCKCDCLYCGIRRSNTKAERYRLTKEEILACAQMGYDFGFRTFVLQSGEDLSYTDEDICDIVHSIKERFPDTAVTLSIGEKTRKQYQMYYDAGCDRYLLRHETASASLYAKLHPEDQTMENRMRCLYDLKDIGYQVGAGMMLHAPFQTTSDLVEDLVFLKKLNPHMIGIGPFIPHKDTPFRDLPAGDVETTLFFIGVLRLMFPCANIPATTALGTIDSRGREKGILAGANVVMPNLSPTDVRGKYLLYDGKICTSDDAIKCNLCMAGRMHEIGYRVDKSRGDYPGFVRK